MPYTLPLRLTIRDVRVHESFLELECVVTDVLGTNVRSVPLTMSSRLSSAAVYAVVQNHVDQIAQGLFARKEAVFPVETDEERRNALLLEFRGKSFTGSTVQ
jgi:hypothetical protein